MELNELKPCPFCGSKPRLEIGMAFCGRNYWYKCANQEHCPAYYLRSKSMFSKQEAMEVWNRRANDGSRDDLALIKELTEDLHATRTELARVQEENERLRAIPEQLHKEMSERMVEECKIARKLTVRKMQERLKEHLEKPEFPWDSFTVAEEVIDQIAKEMLEEI